jgi:hypothetical protein
VIRDLKPGQLTRLMRPILRSPVRITDAHGRLIAVVQVDPVTGKNVRKNLKP